MKIQTIENSFFYILDVRLQHEDKKKLYRVFHCWTETNSGAVQQTIAFQTCLKKANFLTPAKNLKRFKKIFP